MPIEIKELVIKTSVSEDKEKTAAMDPGEDVNLVGSIVAECVEQVMEILKEKEER